MAGIMLLRQRCSIGIAENDPSFFVTCNGEPNEERCLPMKKEKTGRGTLMKWGLHDIDFTRASFK